LSNKLFKCLLLAAASMLPISQAQAHTNSVGYENAGPGSVTFWYGTYHLNTQFTEGSFRLVGQNGAYDSTVSFTDLVYIKPTGLIDGTTNFYSNGTALVGTNSGQAARSWQGVSFTNLLAGSYVFTYVPILNPTQEWAPLDSIILSSTVILTAADVGGTPTTPTIIDSSQGSFSQNDAAASGSEITFGGGTFAPTANLDLNKPVNLLSQGGVVDTTGGDLTFSGPISGQGGLTKTGPGALTLSGDNTYTGDTTLQAGTLRVTGPNALGTGDVNATGGTISLGYSGPFGSDVNVGTGGALTFDTNGHNAVFSGGLSGQGGFTKTGEGLLNYTGAGDITGPINIDGGRLAVNGSVSGSTVNVNGGGSIGGNGHLGGLIVRNRATAAPGNSIGKLTVGTFVIFEKGSTYAVEVNAAGANDRIDVTGTATLEGGTVSVLAESGDYQPLTNYTILNAGGGVTGKFDQVVSNLAFLSPEITYSAKAVNLTLVRNDVTFSAVARTTNQRAVGAVTDRTFGYGGPVYGSLIRGTADAARDAFDQMSGEVYAGAFSSAITDGEIIRNTVLGRLSSPVQPPADGRAVQAWATAYGAWGKVDGDGNAAKLERDSQGVLMGMEATNAEGLRLGVAVGVGQSTADVDARRSSSDTDTAQVMAYGAVSGGGFNLRGGLGYADLSIEAKRAVVLRNLSESLTGKADGHVTQMFAEIGYAFAMGKMSVEPVAGLAGVRLKSEGFAETGGVTALKGRKTDLEATFATLGVRGEGAFAGDALKLKVGAAWRRSLDGGAPSAQLGFVTGGPGFQTLAAAIDKDALTLDAGLDWNLNNRVSVGAAYQGAMGDTSQDHMMKANFSLRF